MIHLEVAVLLGICTGQQLRIVLSTYCPRLRLCSAVQYRGRDRPTIGSIQHNP